MIITDLHVMQLRDAYSLRGPKQKREQSAAETPAILNDDLDEEFDFGFDKAKSSKPFEGEVRTKALRSAQERAREKALKSFEQVSHRKEALRVFGKVKN